MSYEAVIVFADTARMRLRLTARGAFASTLQRARWAAADALRAEPGEHTGPVACVEITRGGRVVETVRPEPDPLDVGSDPWSLAS